MSSFRVRAVLVTSAAALFLSAPAFADTPKPVEGYIVGISGGEIVVDVGRAQGLPPGAELQVYRKLVVEHPVTKKKITDRFPIGSIRLAELGERLSIAKDGKGLTRLPSVGDYVGYVPYVPKAELPKEAPKQPTQPAETKVADDRAALDRAFQETLGRSLYDRIEIWQDWLRQFPDSAYAPAVGNELHWLRTTLERQQGGEAVFQVRPDAPPRVDANLLASAAILEGRPLQVDVVTDNPELVQTMRLHARLAGDPTYVTSELERDGDFNWRGVLPAELTAAPGKVEFFVDSVRADGQLEPREEVQVARVEPNPDAPEKKEGRSRANLLYEFVDFRLGNGADEFHRVEAEYRYAINRILNGFTAGAGIFRGAGASLSELDAGDDSRTLVLSYAYAETDFEFFTYVGLSGRVLIGNRQQLGVENSVLRDALGGALELRFGQEDGTRLMLGGAITDAVGAEAWIDLFIDAIDRIPMSGEVVVTNLPVGENLGVSLNYGVGWEFTDWLTVMARTGWNARTIYDYGFSAGLGTRFAW